MTYAERESYLECQCDVNNPRIGNVSIVAINFIGATCLTANKSEGAQLCAK